MGFAPVHLNNNLLCAVDIWTTGPNPHIDSLIGFSCLPLNSFYEIYKQDPDELDRSIRPFDIDIQPNRPELIDLTNENKRFPKGVSRNKILQNSVKGLNYYTAADYFDKWFQKLKLKFNKRICIISHDWIDKKPFVEQWLGIDSYRQFFDHKYRDIVTASLFANDRADFKNVHLPYPKNFLVYLCSQLKVEYNSKQGLIENCVAIAEIYRKMVTTSEIPF